MNEKVINELKNNIKPELEAEVVYLNERQQSFDKINEAFKALFSKNVSVIIDKCNYRMGCLVNAHKYSSVANQEEVEKDTTELNQILSDLNNEILDIENIGIEMGNNFEEPKYQDFSNKLADVIEKTLEACNETARKATDVLNNKFESFEETNTIQQEPKVEANDSVEEEKEEIIPEEINPTEISTDSIEELESKLNKDLQPIQEDKKDLEDIQNELMGANMVTSIEPVPETTIAPVLQPELHTDLNSFLSQGINEEKVEAPVETKSDEMHEITSAANVDEGYTKVEKVESFDLNDEKEVEGPVLQRTA